MIAARRHQDTVTKNSSDGCDPSCVRTRRDGDASSMSRFTLNRDMPPRMIFGRLRRRAAPRARSFEVESTSRSRSLVEHDLFGKPVSTFPDHALGVDVFRNARGCRHGQAVGLETIDMEADRIPNLRFDLRNRRAVPPETQSDRRRSACARRIAGHGATAPAAR